MAFIIGIIGSGICVYALGYMEDFQAHERRSGPRTAAAVFFALMFVFLVGHVPHRVLEQHGVDVHGLGGHDGLLVPPHRVHAVPRRPSRTPSARSCMNLLGGIAFLVGPLSACVIQLGTLSVPRVPRSIGIHEPGASSCCRCALLAFAGITKAAQMPFHTWLLGAMVAPTPTIGAAAFVHHGQGGRVPARQAGSRRLRAASCPAV